MIPGIFGPPAPPVHQYSPQQPPVQNVHPYTPFLQPQAAVPQHPFAQPFVPRPPQLFGPPISRLPTPGSQPDLRAALLAALFARPQSPARPAPHAPRSFSPIHRFA